MSHLCPKILIYYSLLTELWHVYHIGNATFNTAEQSTARTSENWWSFWHNTKLDQVFLTTVSIGNSESQQRKKLSSQRSIHTTTCSHELKL